MKKYKADINGRAISDDGNLINVDGKATLYNGISVLVFESKEEHAKYIAGLANAWTKEKYQAELYALHDEQYKRIWSTDEFISEPYISHGELASAAATPSSPCHEEAKEILKWYWESYELIVKEIETATEQNANAQLFFETIKFELK